MPKSGPKLTQKKIDSLKKPGRYCDDGGLYLEVNENGAKYWILRTVAQGRRLMLGLGSLKWRTLAEAREEAARLRKIARTGGDPMAEHRASPIVIPTFEAAAREHHAGHSATLKNRKDVDRWLSLLENHAFPKIGKLRVDAIESREILSVLTPIWIEKPETARRTRQRIKNIFDYARARGWLKSGNPCDGIAEVLPKHYGRTTRHFSAMPWADVPKFITDLKSTTANLSIRLAFEYLVLTATRTGEVLGAKWDEIDIDNAVWIIPASRMKMKIEHRVPLSTRCIEILQGAEEISDGGDHIFQGRSKDGALSNMAFLMTLRRMEHTDVTTHGFRAAFRNWTEEQTNTQRSVVEAALAHTVTNQVEAAYLRTDLFNKRRTLMNLWADFVLSTTNNKEET